MKPIILVIYMMSSGLYVEPQASIEDCEDVLLEASIVMGRDLWTGGCFKREEWRRGLSTMLESQ